MPRSATQDRQVRVESSDNAWSTEERNGKTVKYSCHENPMNCLKRQRDMTPKDEHPPPGQKVSNMLLGKSEGQLLIAPERMKWLGLSETMLSCGCVW